MFSFYEWRNNPSDPRSLKQERPRRVLRRGPMFESLEPRCLLSTLTITAASGSFSGPLTYIEEDPGTPNQLTIEFTEADPNNPESSSTYTVTDQSQPIFLQGLAADFWSGNGTNTVTGPAFTVTSLAISTSTSNQVNNQFNNLSIRSIDAPTTVTGFQAVNVGTPPTGSTSFQGLQGIRQPIAINSNSSQPGLTTALTIDDSGGTVGQNWTIAPTSVSFQGARTPTGPDQLDCGPDRPVEPQWREWGRHLQCQRSPRANEPQRRDRIRLDQRDRGVERSGDRRPGLGPRLRCRPRSSGGRAGDQRGGEYPG